MTKRQRVRYEMLVRVRNFGIAHREAFPESSAAGQAFGQLVGVVEQIENHLIRHTQGRTEARKVNVATREAVIEAMKAITATGRQAVAGETGPNPFRMPGSRSAAPLLASARYVMDEAERRSEKFVELGMPPGFLTDFAKLVDRLQVAIGVQHDSRAARRKARAGIASSIARGNTLVAQLDVTVANSVRPDPVRLGEWLGARSVDMGPSSGAEKPPVSETGEAGATPVQGAEQEPNRAS